MGPGRHSTITTAQRAEFWQRYKAGESVLGIINALGQQRTNIHRVLEATGGIRPVARTRSQRVLQFSEREEISRGLAAGDEGVIGPPVQTRRLGTQPVDRSDACSAKTGRCNRSLPLNCSRTGLRSKSQAGLGSTIPVIRRCGCHTRRSIEAFSFRRVAL